MKKKGFMKVLAYVLTICMLVTGMFTSDYSVAHAQTVSDGNAGTTESTTVYFYNSDSYESVVAHAWDDAGNNLTGDWGTTTATTSELGEGWMEVTIPSSPTFHLIFADSADTTNLRRVTVDVTDASKVYTSLKGIYGTKEEAEESLNAEEPEVTDGTKVYFYNSDGYENVIAHAWGDAGDLTGGWGTTTATTSDLGEGWMEVTIPSSPAFYLIFADSADTTDTRRVTVNITDASIVYASLKGIYATKEAAEESVADNGTTKVYFYNSDNYESVIAHAWDDAGNGLTGDWGTTTAATSDLGEGWMEVTIPASPAFHLILADGADDTETRRVTVDVTDTDNVYVSLQGRFTTKEAAEASISGDGGITRVWFYNVYGYETVRVHGWSASGDLFTTQPYATREAIGSNWFYLDVTAEAPFNLQFIGETGEMQQGYVQGGNVYLATTDTFFSSKEAVEEYMNNLSTTIYFLNYNEDATAYEQVYAYAYADGATVGGTEWPGVQAVESEIGENWWQVEIPVNALLTPFELIINDGNDNQLTNIAISDYKNNYVTLKGDGVVYTAQDSAEISAGIVVETVVYLLNNNDWENTSVYIYGRPGEALGGWPGTAPEDAPELGEKWQKITVPAKTPFSIIYFNLDAQAERTEMTLSSDYSLYVTGSGAAYGSQFEAEAACGMVDPSELAVVYFYNSRGWGDINAYTYKIIGEDKPTLGASWPGTAAELAPEIGDNWWKATIPMRASDISEDNSFGIIFNDGVNQTPEGTIINDSTKIYTTVTEKAFATPEEAEAEAAADDYDDGCEEGPNADYDNYEAVYDGAGADLPYITYEAEAASTNGEVLEKSTAYREAIQSEASGRQAVVLDSTGEYVEFTLTEPANALVLRYSIPDTTDGLGQDATLSCYIDGTEKQNLDVTSRYAWVYGSFPFFNTPKDGGPHRYYDEVRVLFDEVMPAGTTIKLQKDADDAAANYVIDFIEMENVGAPKTQPENSLSVTDFGAVPDDGNDDRAAFEECIAAAKEQGKEVWIPAGNYDLVEEEFFTVSGVTIRGAGMWYTNLNGAGAAFKYYGTAKFYDFAMTGVSTIRDDSGDLAGFEGNGSRATNVTIENIWMEHMKVGVWSCNSENLIIQGCRIRNTFADGINLCSATHNAVVRNNHLRNTGDDAIASWPWLANCTGNVIEHNTIQVPTLANGVAIYGGGEFVVDSNYVADTICNGAGVVVGSEFQTPKSFTGTVTVQNNLLERCGSMQVDEGYPIGAIWIWSSTRFADNNMNATFNVFNNVMNDCVQTGITIECGNDLTGVDISDNVINGATDAVHEYYPGGPGTGSGKLGKLTTSNLTGVVHKDDAPNFTLTIVEDEVYTITYELNGGVNDDSNPASYTVETSTITLKNPTRTGYTFGGWYSDSAFATKVTEIAQGSTGNMTLYAKWTAVKYTIKYNLNGGKNSSSNPASYTVETSTITLKSPTKKGYTFKGWYSDKACTKKVTSIAQGSTGNKTLYAKWAINTYTIKYNLNGGKNNSNNPKSYTVATSTITLKNPTKKGYTFKGWYSDKACTKKVTSIAKGSTGTKTLYAKWTANKYTIKFHANGGKGSMAAMKNRQYGKSYTLKNNNFTRKGYTFVGWNTKKDGSGKSYDNRDDVKNLTATNGKTVTLYAQWEAITYKIKYNLNGGTNNKNNPKKYTVETKTIKLKKPTKKGYTFQGWYSNKKCTKKVTQIKKGSTGAKTLYAKWKKN